MSNQTIKIVIPVLLLLHGLGHGGAIGALIWIHYRPETDTGGWRVARSWLFASLATQAAMVIAIIFWALSAVGFVAASMSFWEILVPGEVWRQLALGSSVVSTLGLVLFLGTWPAFNTLAALAVNIAVFITQLWLHWPSRGLS